MELDQHEIDQVIQLFAPQVQTPLQVSVDAEGNDGLLRVSVVVNGAPHLYTVPSKGSQKVKHLIKNCVYLSLQKETGLSQPWGSHTGVHPVSLIHQLEREHADVEEVLRTEYFWSEEKIRLSNRIAQVQRPLLNMNPKSLDIYIGIPFCPSRCSYCSFSLIGIEKKGKLQPAYADALAREIKEVGRAVQEMGYLPRAIYVGGGTPTALLDQPLQQILAAVDETFPRRLELTVEAGRPDTITESKLTLIRQAGATRISINPQTMNQKTLDLVKRKHTVEQVHAAFHLARSKGFSNINMDLIAGLPNETTEDFAHSLGEIFALSPEAVTVHTLAVKRSSEMQVKGKRTSGNQVAAHMLDHAYKRLSKTAYEPYCLYRQKYMADNGENVGFAFPGKACLYNIDLMEENTHVLAMGSGGVSKRLKEGNRLCRVSDPKDVEVYLQRISDTITRNIDFFK